MASLDFTNQGRRPNVSQVIAAWKKAGQPATFTVEYGETFAEFTRYAHFPAGRQWDASGNGCRGVDRDGVLKKLNEVPQGG